MIRFPHHDLMLFPKFLVDLCGDGVNNGCWMIFPSNANDLPWSSLNPSYIFGSKHDCNVFPQVYGLFCDKWKWVAGHVE